MTHIPVMPAKPHPQCLPGRRDGWAVGAGSGPPQSLLLEIQLWEFSLHFHLVSPTVEGPLGEFDKEH